MSRPRLSLALGALTAPSRAFALLGAAWLLAATSGCDGCGSQKPYTPFGVASALPSAATAPQASASASAEATPVTAPSGFAVRKAELVPGAATTWQGPGLDLQAPPERGFALVLPADFDGNEKPDALAWLVPTEGAKQAPPGELWYFADGAAAQKLSALPGFVPSSADCKLTTALVQTGPHSATLDVAAACAGQLIARAPSRAIVVVAPTVEHPLLLTLRAASAAPDEALDFRVDSSDQDGDGRDDVRLTATLNGPNGATPVSADLVWLDRAAGASRSASEPAASLRSSSAKVLARSRLKRGAGAAEQVANVRRLLSSLCAEGGVARLFDEEGVPFRCGELGKTLDALAHAEVRAALAQDDVLLGFSALRRDGWYFGRMSQTQRKTVEQELLAAVGKFDAEPPRVIRTQPLLLKFPHYSPLWFDHDGALLVRGSAGVTRILGSGPEEALDVEAGVPSWPLDLVSADGQRLLGAVHACDRSELLFTRADAQHPVLPALPSQLLAARPASCTGHGSGPSVNVAPLGFDERGLNALVAGTRVWASSPNEKRAPELPRMGTPLSPDGRWLVSPSPLGLLLVGEHKELWQTAKLQEYADAARFEDCVVANDARAVACLDAGRALLFLRPKPSANATSHKK